MEKGQTNNSNPSQPSSGTGKNYVDGVFVSYGWVDESERTVNELELAFEKHGIHMVRDKRDLPFRSSIKEFEERIGRGQSVVLVISDKYLRSEHCMYELLEVSKNENLRERIFPIVLPDARIYNPVERLSYVKYWDGRIKELNEAIKQVEVAADLEGIHADLNKFVRIRASFDHLTDTLRDINALTPDMHAKDDYATLIHAVENAIKDQKEIVTPELQGEAELSRASTIERILPIITGVITVLFLSLSIASRIIAGRQSFYILFLSGIILIMWGIFLIGRANEEKERLPVYINTTSVRMVPVPKQSGKERSRLLLGGWGSAGLGIVLVALAFFGFRDSPIPIKPALTATYTVNVTSTSSVRPAPTQDLSLTPPITAPPITAPPCTEQSTSRYGFDCGFKLWSIIEKKDNDSKAVTQVTTTQVPNQYGNLTTVLVLTVDFTGGRDDRSRDSREKGEVEVDLSGLPPTGYEHRKVDDLAGKTLTAYVWASRGASGDPEYLNGFQLFLRDEKSISCYGNWTNIEPYNEEKWFRVVWEEPTMEEKLAEKDKEKPKCLPEFNINKPMILGLKIAVGEKSTIDYTAPLTIYLDDVDWQTP
jgi:hypothetical protein